MRLLLKFCLSLLLIGVLTGCTRHPTDPNDPLEPFNRAMFAFNMGVDHMIYRPVTKVYTTIIPPPLQRGVSNVFSNLGELTTIPNDLLQGKFKYMFMDFWRFVINSTIGIGGLFDVATRMGLPKHYEDFGMTLAYYSDKKTSPYLVLPFIGPITLRSAVTQPLDYYTGPWPYMHPDSFRYSMLGLKWLNIRAGLMPANKLIDTAFDPYAFMRSAYMQRRMQMIQNNEHDYEPGKAKPYQESWITISEHANTAPSNESTNSDNKSTNTNNSNDGKQKPVKK